jgi:hypothetical protein
MVRRYRGWFLLCGGLLASCTNSAPAARPTVSAALVFPTETTDPVLNGAQLIRQQDGTGTAVIAYPIPYGSTRIMVRLLCTSGAYSVLAQNGRTLFHGPCSADVVAGGAAAPARVGTEVTVKTDKNTRWTAEVWSFS